MHLTARLPGEMPGLQSGDIELCQYMHTLYVTHHILQYAVGCIFCSVMKAGFAAYQVHMDSRCYPYVQALHCSSWSAPSDAAYERMHDLTVHVDIP